MLNALPAVNVYGPSNPLQEQTAQSRISEEIRTNNNERVDVRSVENLDEDAGAAESHSREGDAGRAPPQQLPPQPHPRNAFFDEEGEFAQRVNEDREGETRSRRALDSFLKNAEAGRETARAGQGNAETMRPSVDTVA